MNLIKYLFSANYRKNQTQQQIKVHANIDEQYEAIYAIKPSYIAV